MGLCSFWCQMGFCSFWCQTAITDFVVTNKGPGIGFCLKHLCFCSGAQGDPQGCQCCWVGFYFTGSRKLTLWHHAHCFNWQRPWFFFSCKGIKVLALYSEGPVRIHCLWCSCLQPTSACNLSQIWEFFSLYLEVIDVWWPKVSLFFSSSISSCFWQEGDLKVSAASTISSGNCISLFCKKHAGDCCT